MYAIETPLLQEVAVEEHAYTLAARVKGDDEAGGDARLVRMLHVLVAHKADADALTAGAAPRKQIKLDHYGAGARNGAEHRRPRYQGAYLNAELLRVAGAGRRVPRAPPSREAPRDRGGRPTLQSPVRPPVLKRTARL